MFGVSGTKPRPLAVTGVAATPAFKFQFLGVALIFNGGFKMLYTNDKGVAANLPWSLEHALICGTAQFMDADGCKVCGKLPATRFVKTGECILCVDNDAAQVFKLWKMGSPDRPSPFPLNKLEAAAAGVDYYYRDALCKRGPHFVQPHVKTGRCVVCAKEKVDAVTVISRDDAKAAGKTLFRTGLPCHKGHIGWRYVSNSGCVDCMRGEPIVAPALNLERFDELPIITVDQQRTLFIGYATDGKKMIDPDGKKWSRPQFNIMYGSPSRFILSHDRGETREAWDAFIKNFGPQRVVV